MRDDILNLNTELLNLLKKTTENIEKINKMKEELPYKKRKVRCTRMKDKEGIEFYVDTVMITDAKKTYETAISHPKFNKEKWIIVRRYYTRKQAIKGHKKWINIMRNSPKQILNIEMEIIGVQIKSIMHKR